MGGFIKSIQTEYNGYHFRSLTEARWAIFFDELGIKYMYEPEGYEMSDGTKYLPDFYLPESETFFEAKGIMTDIDMHKIEQLQEDLKIAIAIGYSDMTFQSSSDDWGGEEYGIYYFLESKSGSYLGKCPKCNRYFFFGNTGSYRCRCCGFYDGDATLSYDFAEGDLSYFSTDGKIYPAIKKSRQARFDHNQKPKPKYEDPFSKPF